MGKAFSNLTCSCWNRKKMEALIENIEAGRILPPDPKVLQTAIFLLRQELKKSNELLLDMWEQFAYERNNCLTSGGLSALEDTEKYLKATGLIDKQTGKRV